MIECIISVSCLTVAVHSLQASILLSCMVWHALERHKCSISDVSLAGRMTDRDRLGGWHVPSRQTTSGQAEHISAAMMLRNMLLPTLRGLLASRGLSFPFRGTAWCQTAFKWLQIDKVLPTIARNQIAGSAMRTLSYTSGELCLCVSRIAWCTKVTD